MERKENLYTYGHIRTNSGQYVDPFNPNPETLVIEDIAHALSMQPRFGGHLPIWYSVADHCIACYHKAPDDLKYEALMHDCAEAYLMDLPSPIKMQLHEYSTCEYNLMYVLSRKFNFKFPLPPEIKGIDNLELEWEWENIMLKKPVDTIYPLTAHIVETKYRFLEIFHSLQKGI